MATSRTPGPALVDRVAENERVIQLAHAKRLKNALNQFAKAAMEFERATPGTVGHRHAQQRASACRKAVEGATKEFVRRERLDAHARSFMQVLNHAEQVEKHANLSPADAVIVRRVLRQLTDAIRQQQQNMELQRAGVDEQALSS